MLQCSVGSKDAEGKLVIAAGWCVQSLAGVSVLFKGGAAMSNSCAGSSLWWWAGSGERVRACAGCSVPAFLAVAKC